MLDEIEKTIATLFEPDQVIEIRTLGRLRSSVRSGYFRDHRLLAANAEELDKSGDSKGIYVVLNEIDESLYSRSPDRITPANIQPNLTLDQDIVRRRWLPVDFDPKRDSKTSSNEEEHQLAIKRAKEVRDTLEDMGWPAPILGDSGNGAHLLWRIDLPNDADSRLLVEDCLRALAEMFGDDKVDVDVKNSNAARIWKLYGTCARKGNNTKDRPWRVSRLVEVPQEIEVVPKELMLALADMHRERKKSERQKANIPRRKIDLEKWLLTHGIDIVRVKEASGGGKIFVLSSCPFNPDHTDRAAFAAQWPDGHLQVKCHHNGCDGKGWRDLVKLYSQAYEDRNEYLVHDESSPAITLDDVTVVENNGKLRFSPMMAADIVIANYRIITTQDMVMWIYQDGIWEPKGELIVDKALVKIAGDYYTIRNSRETIKKIQLLTLRPDMVWNPDPYKFGIKNGVVDLRDGSFLPYSPEDYVTLRSPIVYDPEAKCHEIIKFLRGSLGHEEDLLTVIDLFVALSITKALPYFVSLIGPGSNGKKVLEVLMQNYVGFHQVTHVSLDALDGNAFIRGEIKDKRVMINTEVTGKKMESHRAKAISSGDRMESDRKNSTRIEFTPFCLIVFDTNDPPKFYDRSHGFERRFIKLDFPYIFTDNPKPDDPYQKLADPKLEEKVISQRELSGLLNIVIKRAPDVIETGKIYRRRDGAEIVKEYELQTYSLSKFVDMFLELSDDRRFMPTETLYEAYVRFCRKINITPHVINLLGSQIHKRFLITSRDGKVGKAAKKGFDGITLNSEALDDFLENFGVEPEEKEAERVSEIIAKLVPSYDEPPVEKPVAAGNGTTAPMGYRCQMCNRIVEQLIDFPGGSFCLACAANMKAQDAQRRKPRDRYLIQRDVRTMVKQLEAEIKEIVPTKIGEALDIDPGVVLMVVRDDGFVRTDDVNDDGLDIYRRAAK
jgi:P4 family phage/plasmid primase-like protien